VNPTSCPPPTSPFGPSRAIRENDTQRLADIRQEITSITLTVARFEPVTILVRESEQALAREFMGDKVSYAVCNMVDFWLHVRAACSREDRTRPICKRTLPA
jgi:agmatine/peptidylarginine deiminase